MAVYCSRREIVALGRSVFSVGLYTAVSSYLTVSLIYGIRTALA